MTTTLAIFAFCLLFPLLGGVSPAVADGDISYEFSVYRTRDLKDHVEKQPGPPIVWRRELFGGP